MLSGIRDGDLRREINITHLNEYNIYKVMWMFMVYEALIWIFKKLVKFTYYELKNELDWHNAK